MPGRKDHVDIAIIGAGAAGLFAGGRLAARGRQVAVIDHSHKPGEKIRISGGGRCNFTNINTVPERFLSANPHFAKSALARFTPWDFMDMMAAAGLTWHEKTLGQLFCDQRSGAVISMLIDHLQGPGGQLCLGETVTALNPRSTGGFDLVTSGRTVTADAVIIASGGLSIPKIGATGFAYDLARRFGHHIIPPRAGLVPFTFSEPAKSRFAAMSGVAQPVTMQAVGGQAFDEAMLFTHRGISGPAALQISSYWHPGDFVRVDLLPGRDIAAQTRAARGADGKRLLKSLLADLMPTRLVDMVLDDLALDPAMRLAAMGNAAVDALAARLQDWQIKPSGTEGWRTAEVTVGGVATDDLSSKTMESIHVPGLYFIGECVDVTGWLGGYNFQWAWASAAAAADALTCD